MYSHPLIDSGENIRKKTILRQLDFSLPAPDTTEKVHFCCLKGTTWGVFVMARLDVQWWWCQRQQKVLPGFLATPCVSPQPQVMSEVGRARGTNHCVAPGQPAPPIGRGRCQ